MQFIMSTGKGNVLLLVLFQTIDNIYDMIMLTPFGMRLVLAKKLDLITDN